MKIRILLGVVLLMLLVSCGQQTPTPTEIILPSETLPEPTITSTFTPSPVPPTETATVVPTETSTPTITPSPTPSIIGPTDFPSNVNPLTGLKVDNLAMLERRPIALKANLFPRNYYRPPWGLSLADLIFDYYHNAGYSRLHAIYLGTDSELVGAVRSGRMFDYDLVYMYKSIFAYGSADPIVNRRLMGAEFGNRLVLERNTIPCPPTAKNPLCRFEPNKTDLLLGSTTALSQYITDKGIENGRQNLDGMAFSTLVPPNGTAANQVFVSYSQDDYVRWDYDPTTGRYLRFQDNVFHAERAPEEFVPLLDRVNNQQISAANVVVVFVRHEYYRQPPGEIIDILLSGSGKAIAFRDGQMYEVQWNRPSITSVLFLSNPDGTPFPFKPGNTWFQIVVNSSKSLQPGEGVYRYQFSIP